MNRTQSSLAEYGFYYGKRQVFPASFLRENGQELQLFGAVNSSTIYTKGGRDYGRICESK